MTNFDNREQKFNPDDNRGELSDELAQKFDTLFYNTAESLEMSAVPDCLETIIKDVKFGRYGKGTLLVGSTTTSEGYDGLIEFNDTEDRSQYFSAQYSKQLAATGWYIDGGRRWSSRQLLDHLESQWPSNDESAAHNEAFRLSQDPEAAKGLTAQKVIELAENYAILSNSGNKRVTARWDYVEAIHRTKATLRAKPPRHTKATQRSERGGCQYIHTTFRLDRSDLSLGMPECHFEMNFPTKDGRALVFSIHRSDFGAIRIDARRFDPETEKMQEVTMDGLELVFELTESILNDLVKDKLAGRQPQPTRE